MVCAEVVVELPVDVNASITGGDHRRWKEVESVQLDFDVVKRPVLARFACARSRLDQSPLNQRAQSALVLPH